MNLQAKDTTVSEETRGADLLRSHYVSLRSYTAFVCEVESLRIDAANGKDIPEIPEAVAKYFQGTLDLAYLKI